MFVTNDLLPVGALSVLEIISSASIKLSVGVLSGLIIIPLVSIKLTVGVLPTLGIIWRRGGPPSSRLLDEPRMWADAATSCDRLAVRPMVACDRDIGHRTVTLQQLANDLIEAIDIRTGL